MNAFFSSSSRKKNFFRLERPTYSWSFHDNSIVIYKVAILLLSLFSDVNETNLPRNKPIINFFIYVQNVFVFYDHNEVTKLDREMISAATFFRRGKVEPKFQVLVDELCASFDNRGNMRSKREERKNRNSQLR